MANKRTEGLTEGLFTDSGPVDLEKLVAVLEPLVKVKRDSKEIFLTPKGQKLSAKQKVLVYILTRKALKLDGEEDSESVSAAKVDKGLGGVPKGTIDAAFKELREKSLLTGKGKNYEVPNYRVSGILEDLQANVGTNKE